MRAEHSPLREFAEVYGGKHVFACASCGLKQADMTQVDGALLDGYYRTIYRQTGIAGNARPDTYPARASSILQDAEAALAARPRRVFEVGAGHGYNIAAVRAAYPDAELFTDEIDESVALPGGSSGEGWPTAGSMSSSCRMCSSISPIPPRSSARHTAASRQAAS